ncbi:MlaC/ttg2D family ABC transporter substrate-binding protein [Vitreoscilla stercoraria]|uniref:ABC transporter substrate-binding protein n=1 Tax=Vitreoscilla stercoraria TaxID=61 RepID=A0ABY4E8E0_VITST|nr:ABC transporter substrate-binding protein [Vitreoscilla stercoraria]UOO91534.1 ABC transporter substrate-binding protein [Vitreoscilla stercoraria]
MKTWWQSCWMILCVFFSIQLAQANNLTHPAQLQMQQNTNAIMAIINDNSLNNPQKIQRLNVYADRHLDYQRIAALSVGQPWRQFTTQQKQDFIAAFKDMMISVYANTALLAAQNAKITVLPRNSSDNTATQARVYTQILNNKNKSYAVDYQMYKSGNTWKIYNINVEGASVVTIYRNQFGEVIQKQGIDGLIQALRNKTIAVK